MRRLLKRETFYLFFLLMCMFPIFLFGLFYPDEGYILHTASRLLDGEVMYRDFYFVYTPFSAWIAAAFFLGFGENVLAGRVGAYALSVVSIVTLFFTLRAYTKKLFWIFLATGMYVSWGIFHINFFWPSMVAISCSLIAAFFYVQSERDRRFLIGTGIFTALSILSKQNLGIALFGAFLFLFLTERFITNRKSTLLSFPIYFLGFAGVILIFALQLLLQGAFTAFLQNNYLNLFQKIFVEGTISTPLIYGEGFYSLAKAFFYMSPLLLCIPAIGLAVRSKSSSIVLPVVCAAVYIAGVRPVTDYVHVSPLFSLAGLPFFVLVLFLRKKTYVIPLLSYAIAVVVIGLYSPLFLYYYRWQEPVIKQTHFVNHKRVLLFTEKKYLSEIPELTLYIDSISKKDSYLYINYYAPMLYFLLERRNPTKYDYVSGNALTNKEQMDIIKMLEQKNVQVVMTHAIVKGDKSPAYRYIQKAYVRKKQINDLIIWQKEKV